MQKFSPKLKIFLCSALILSSLAIILFTLSMFVAYDSGPNYFKPSVIVSIANAVAVISIIILLGVFLFIPKGALDGATPITLPVIIPSAICTVVFAAIGIVLLLCASKSSDLSKSVFTGITKGKLTGIAGCFCIISAGYFLVNCFIAPDGNKSKHAFVGFSIPVSATLLIAISYFDTTVSMNAPVKAMFHLSLISFMLWFLYELRAMIEKPMPRAYFAFGLCTMMLSGIASLPFIVYAIGGGLSSPVYPTYLLYNTASLAIFVYSAVRIIIFVCARDLLERISEQTEAIEFESEEDLPEEENSEVENIIEDREEENNDET